MSVRLFDQGDRAYRAWSRASPGAFVANTTRSTRSEYFVIHRASCPSISRYDSAHRPGGFTEREYVKAVSEDLGELVRWGRRHRTVRPTQHVCVHRRETPRTARGGDDRLFPDELDQGVGLEGGALQVLVSRYERDPRARRACIRHFGCRCQVCDIDFEQRYGDRGRGFIHVHHLRPVSKTGRRYTPDPRRDLVPVCPNCHAMLHVGPRLLTVQALRRLVYARTSSISVQRSPRRRR